MPYGNFVGYEPVEGGATDFTTRDGKKLRLIGQVATELRDRLDASPFVAPGGMQMSAAPQNFPLEVAAQATATAPPNTSPRTETTALTDADEREFRKWAKKNRLRDVDHPDSHYDYRGFFQENKGKIVRDAANPEAHFTDTYKQHGHPTFSEESRYSSGEGDGGHWEDGERFVPPETPYTEPPVNPLVTWLRNEPPPPAPPPQEPSHEERQAALMAWIRGDDPVLKATPAAPNESLPEKFQTHAAPRVSSQKTFARRAVASASRTEDR